MINTSRLSHQAIKNAKPRAKDYWLSDDEGTRGGGRLVVRVSPSGSKIFYFNYWIKGNKSSIPIGPFSAAEGQLYSLDDARTKAREYSALHRQPETRDVKAVLTARLEALEQEKAREREAEIQRQKDELLASKYSLKALCEAYIQYLKRIGKSSARDFANHLNNHVYTTEWASKPAKAFTKQQAAGIVRDLIAAGKRRTATKVRSILRRAFAMAADFDGDPDVPHEFRPFEIEFNPVASVKPPSGGSKARKRVLSEAEFGELWRKINDPVNKTGTHFRALRLVIQLGGQRGLQLLRVKRRSVDRGNALIVLFDGKGNRPEPRTHVLPLVGRAVAETEELIQLSETVGSEYLFPGRTAHIGQDSISTIVKEVCDDCIRLGITDSDDRFQFSDVRRTAETAMASLEIHKDIRAQIQSHGLDGVQDRHYDMYQYLRQKREALVKLHEKFDEWAWGKGNCPYSQ